MAAPLEVGFAIDQTCPDTLELDILYCETSIVIEGSVSARGVPRHKIPRTGKAKNVYLR